MRYEVWLLLLLSQRNCRCDGSHITDWVLMKLNKNQRKPRVFKASDLCPYYNRRVDPSDNSCCFHISFSFTDVATHQRPPCVKGAGRNLWFLTGGLSLSIPCNPSVTASPCHLPLHKGGFSPYNNFTNYAVSICKGTQIIPQDLLLSFAVLW